MPHEFLVMAATQSASSRLLLPQTAEDEDDEELEDPHPACGTALRYKFFKEAAVFYGATRRHQVLHQGQRLLRSKPVLQHRWGSDTA